MAADNIILDAGYFCKSCGKFFPALGTPTFGTQCATRMDGELKPRLLALSVAKNTDTHQRRSHWKASQIVGPWV